MGNASGGFNGDLKIDRRDAAGGGFDRGNQGIDRIDTGRTADLCDHNLVEARAALFQKVNHITISIRSVQAINPH